MNRLLDNGEYLVRKNSISIQTDADIDNPKRLASSLQGMITQPTNRNVFIVMNKERIFLRQRKKQRRLEAKGDSLSRWAQWRMNNLGEPPVLYDPELTQQIQRNIQLKLLSKGYYRAQVRSEVNKNERKKTAKINYIADSGPLFVADTFLYISTDPTIKAILEQHRSKSFLLEGEAVSRQNYELEVARINKLLRNRGYALFNSNFIKSIDGDSIGHKVNLRLEIINPTDSTFHQRYRVGDVHVFTSTSGKANFFANIDTVINGIQYHSADAAIRVAPTLLQSNIALKPDELFSQEKVDRSNVLLNRLNLFQFVSIRSAPDSLNSQVLNYQIVLQPLKKYEASVSIRASNTERQLFNARQNLIGINLFPSLAMRNDGGNGRTLRASGGLGMDFNIGRNTSLANTLDLRLQVDIFQPKFKDNFATVKGLNRLGLINDASYLNAQDNSISNFSIQYNYLDILDFYQINILNISETLDYDLNKNNRLSIRRMGLNLFLPDERDAFKTILSENPFLERSFGNQLLLGMLFRDISYVHQNQNENGAAWNFRSTFGLVGWEMGLLNRGINLASGNDERFAFTDGDVEFSNYLSLNLDANFSKRFGPTKQIAFRLANSFARPLGYSEEVPYLQQFFVGGPNSLRGWIARGIGPGSFLDPLTLDAGNRNLFYQAADFLLEGSVEYRTLIVNIAGINFNGAVFIDAGNIWTLEADTVRPGSQFVFTEKTDDSGEVVERPFWQEIAINTGFGLRMDYSYFVLRLDLGFPIRNPYVDPDGGWNWRPVNTYRLSNLNFNLMLGYPF